MSIAHLEFVANSHFNFFVKIRSSSSSMFMNEKFEHDNVKLYEIEKSLLTELINEKSENT